MSRAASTVRFRLAGWVGELTTRDRRLIRQVRELFYEPALPEEPADGVYRAFVDRRFGTQKRHWMSGPDPERFLRITAFYPSLLEALAESATREAAVSQGAGRQPLAAGAVSGPAGMLIVFGEGDGLRPRLVQALARSGFPYCGDGLVVVKPGQRTLIPCARAIAITRPAHAMSAHARGQKLFRNREREIHRFVLPETRHPTGEQGSCRIAALLFAREAETPAVRAMSPGEALIGAMEHCLGEEGTAFGDLGDLAERVPAYEVSVRGSKRTLDLLRTEVPELAAGGGAREAFG
jgi:hypothetical protein